MSWYFDPSAWVTNVTQPSVADFQGIATDLHTRGGAVDGGGYGRANTSYIMLLPGALPGTQYSVTGASWTAGVATLIIGGHTISVNQRVTVSLTVPSGYNTTTDSVVVTAITSTTISFALAVNPGSWSSGGTVLVDGIVPATGTLAFDPSMNLKCWNGSSWVAAVTAATAPIWEQGAGAPSSGLGSNGDMYLDNVAGNIYGPKTAGAWGAADLSVIGPGYKASSTTSITIGTGSQSFTTQTGLAYSAGCRARASQSTNPANYVEGYVTSYAGATLVINVDSVGGSGTIASWNINVSGLQGAQGIQGIQGLPGSGWSFAYQSVSTNTTLTAAATEQLIEVNAGSGPVNITLFAAASGNAGFKVTVVKTDSSSNAVTIVGTINGAANQTMSIQNEALTVQSTGLTTGSNFRIV